MNQLKSQVERIPYVCPASYKGKLFSVNKELAKKAGLGAIITVSLIYQNMGFQARRIDHPDDLLEPRPPVGAEEFIQYHRDNGSKFLVLGRQYSIENKL